MKIFCLCTLLWFASAVMAAPSHQRILFVGNSFSFYNNGIHNHYGALVRAEGDWKAGKNRVRLLSLSGGHIHEQMDSLAHHLSQDTRGYSAVVLQAHSNEAIDPEKHSRFVDSLTKAVNIVRQQGQEPYLFMTWAYQNEPDMSEALWKAYDSVSQKLEVELVPIGLAFMEAQQRFSHINLYVKDILGLEQKGDDQVLSYRKDIKHPSVAGTYLAACVFYSAIHNKSPEGNLFDAGLTKQDALSLQKLSWEVVQKVRTQNAAS